MKTFKIILSWTTVLLLIGSAIWYSWLTIIGEIRPVTTTFILAFIYFTISEAAYWSKAKKDEIRTGNKTSIWNNMAMHAGYVNVIMAMLTVIGVKIYNGNFIDDFNIFQYICLILSAIVLIIWKLTKNAQLGFVLVQLVAVIAYIPMFQRVLVTEVQTESNVMWVAILFASLTAIPKVWEGYKKNKDWLSIVYIARVIPSNIALVCLVFAKDIGIYPF
ncbi:hypothetical protein CL684_00450 [Candidatus Campbellbacteria bacterium]|nr:hypothetical protein [Candidatus Campbellbacteria bacterium]|tara:strand:- start:1304 stop:1957 length:654 start_codon:yes stop_codon:yes gene_type:complete